jgi:molecular chaperone IbpA
MFNEIERIGNQIETGYPPYNITKVSDEKTIIEIAVAGFSLPMLEIEVREGKLTISGENASKKDTTYVHKGISSRKFTRVFRLSEYTVVSKASLIDGILYVELVQELPDAMKPRRIPINTNGDSQTADELLLG